METIEAFADETVFRNDENGYTVLVVKAGKIIERGTHQQLMDLGGYYATLYSKQFESETAETLLGQ